MNKSKTATVLKSLAAMLILVGLTYSGFVLLQSETLGRNAQVGTVHVGGMTVTRARKTIEDKIVTPASKPFAVTVDGHEYAIDPVSAGLAIDVDATLDQLAGNEWSPAFQFKKYFGDQQVEPIVTIDSSKLDSALSGVSLASETAPVEPSVAFKRGAPSVTPGKAGVMIDSAAARKSLSEHFAQANGTLDLPTTVVKPKVSDADVEAFVAKNAPIIGMPVIVKIGSKSATLDSATLYAATTLSVVGDKLAPTVSGDVLLTAVNKALPTLGTPAKDATFKIWNGKPYVVPEQAGRGVTAQELVDSVTPVILNAQKRTAKIALTDIEPGLTAVQAKKLGIVEKLSSFTQHFPYAAYRVTNIGRAAHYLDGTIVMPHAIFSMNDTVHERTVANGYTTGFIIGPGGQFREDLGGGVSTATTAVWTAAFYANMERIEQRAHSFWISRYRPGLEATVSWGSLDMRWRNPLDTAVLIKASITDSSVTVTIYGTKTFDEVQAISSPRRNVRPFATVYSTDPLCVGQDGVTGFDITVTRKVIKNSAVVSSEDFVTSYDAGPHVICGKKPATQ